MPNEQLIEITKLCWRVDLAARTLYERFSEQSADTELATFWNSAAADELAHLKYWDELGEWLTGHPVAPLFEDPDWTIGGLHRNVQRAEHLIAHPEEPLGPEQMLRAAIKMEFYLSHPAFEALFLMSVAEGDLASPARQYEHHIGSFVGACARFAPNDDLQLLAETLVWTWRANRLAAERLAQIGALQRLVPMCANCHQVRDATGEWQSIESFLERRHDIEVSHGMCPDCVTELYPEFTGGSDGD